MLEDKPGVGKTLSAVLLINSTRYQTGGPVLMILVSPCTDQWMGEQDKSPEPVFISLRGYSARMNNFR